MEEEEKKSAKTENQKKGDSLTLTRRRSVVIPGKTWNRDYTQLHSTNWQATTQFTVSRSSIGTTGPCISLQLRLNGVTVPSARATFSVLAVFRKLPTATQTLGNRRGAGKCECGEGNERVKRKRTSARGGQKEKF